MAGDPEGAHSYEDQLAWDVLRTIAEGLSADPASICRASLASRDLDFPRWCA